MADYRSKLEDAIVAAHNAGDTEGAQVLANELKAWAPKQDIAWSDIPLEAAKNLPSSALNFGKAVAQPFAHPVDTLQGIGNLLIGTTENVGSGLVNKAVGMVDPDLVAFNEKNRTPDKFEASANAVGQFYKDRYGGIKELKNTLATDPVGAAADASILLSGGAGLANKVGKLTKSTLPLRVGEELNIASNVLNPVNIAKPVAKLGGKLVSNTLGLTTVLGPKAIEEAARSGLKGKSEFMGNLSNKIPMTNVLDDAKANLQVMQAAKSAEYRSGMMLISKDKSVLSFDGIDKALNNAYDMATFKGQVKNAKAAEIIQKINDDISKWKNLDPAEFHTPEGIDALKQRIGGLVESIPFEEKTARAAANGVYNAIKTEISSQAPTYANVMKDYSQASDQIREIEKALSLGQKSTADAGLRKLQSIMRNNVNTNYGNRTDLAKTLQQEGGRDLMPALAGQAMNSWTARGLGGQAENIATLLLAATHNPALLGLLPFQSPKVVGAAAYGAGSAARYLSPLLPEANTLPLAYQAGRLPIYNPQ